MSRYSDDSSDSDDSYKKSKKKKHRRSRSRSVSRSKSSRKKRSRSRSRDKRKKRSRSRDRRDRKRSRSRSRDRRRNRSGDRKRSRSKDRRRSRSRSYRRNRQQSRSDSPEERNKIVISDSGDEVEVVEKKDVNQHDVMAAISDQIKRARAISDIDSESFTPQSFKSTKTHEAVVNDSGMGAEDKFQFGTSIERKTAQDEDLQKLAREGLIHPQLFGDQAAREKRYLQHIWTIRQRALQKMKG